MPKESAVVEYAYIGSKREAEWFDLDVGVACVCFIVGSALRSVSRGMWKQTQLPAISMFSRHFGNECKAFISFLIPLADLNAKLKDYVLKQDLKKNFTEYKNAADRKELFQEVYLKLAKEGQTLK